MAHGLWRLKAHNRPSRHAHYRLLRPRRHADTGLPLWAAVRAPRVRTCGWAGKRPAPTKMTRLGQAWRIISCLRCEVPDFESAGTARLIAEITKQRHR
jgi:hypothetical protein